MGNVFEDYIKRETERMAMQAEMAIFKDESAEQEYILVKDDPDNIKRFNKKMEFYGGIPEHVIVFYNEPEYYDLIIDGYQTRYRIKKEKERQDKINNPKVDLGINSKEELVEYLINENIKNEEVVRDEFGTEDYEVDKAELNAKRKKLNRLVDKYL